MNFNIFERKRSRVIYLAKYYDSGERVAIWENSKNKSMDEKYKKRGKEEMKKKKKILGCKLF